MEWRKVEAEKVTLEIVITCPKGFKPHKVTLIQSPGPIGGLGEYGDSDSYDPFVTKIKVIKREKTEVEVV